jgi:hypothetical protein
MSSSVIIDPAATVPEARRLNPAELKIDLLCQGVLVDESCRIAERGRPVFCRPGDPASGLELILPGELRELWVNVPVSEEFVAQTPYRLILSQGDYRLQDVRKDLSYGVTLAPRPDWYERRTKSGVPMSQIGVLQGTILTVDLGGPACLSSPAEGSAAYVPKKTVEEVVETVSTAQRRSGITFVLLRALDPDSGSLMDCFPYIKALKEDVGILVGVQFPPAEDLRAYQEAGALGVDHFSFSMAWSGLPLRGGYEADGAATRAREHLVRALETCVRRNGKGKSSGQITAGIEPIEDTLRGIDDLVAIGALPLVSIFRPRAGTAGEGNTPPGFGEMIPVFQHVYEACRSHHLPIGLLPNLSLSVIIHPEDTLYLADDSQEGRSYQQWIFTMKQVMRPYFLRRMRKQPASQAR